MNYTIIVVSNKQIQRYAPNYYFATRDEAERYAEGMTHGLWLSGKKWAVVMLHNGEYDSKTAVTKNLDSKKSFILFRDLNCNVTKSVCL